LVPGQKTYGGIIQTIVLTVKDEGFFALYRGATPTILGAVPYEGIKFGTVGILEKSFPLQPNEDGSLPKPSPWRKMLFGGMGGVMAGLLTYPNDTVVCFAVRFTSSLYVHYLLKHSASCFLMLCSFF
jgi:hypothetical protein